jgi:preprotein translocase subunit SecG
MYTILLILLVLNSVTLVTFVLLQQGKGADAGAAFGSGASATVFGARGSSSFLSRTTAVLATTFFILALILAWMSQSPQEPAGLAERAAEMPFERTAPQPVRVETEDGAEEEEPVPDR